MNDFVIGLDVDGVICDMVNPILDINNANYEKLSGEALINKFIEEVEFEAKKRS